ncbi:MAG: hypothetical protein KDC44_10135, partial [Phaeodactylibacter sp.]|nr:hypothetical protein [Phaeodactylibacter sp.]
MQSIRLLTIILFLGSFWISCSILEKNLENALNNTDTQAQLEKITREVVHNAIYQAAQDSTLGPLKEQLAQVLDSLQLTADATSRQLVDNLLGAKTNELLSMQMDSMRQKFNFLLQDTGQFLDEDISPFIKNAILQEFELSLKSWLLTLQAALASQEMQQSLNQFRQYLSAELDSLLNASSNSLAANLDEFLLPRLDSMFVNLD